MDRRSFLGSAALSAAGLVAPASSIHAARSSRILVLGGTNYLGPSIVQYAVDAGHEVTLFNRGITRPRLFRDIEQLRGDRRDPRHGLNTLGRRRQWDAVIDVWPADAAMVEASAKLLADRVDYYGFVSSIAVYRSFAQPWLSESAPLRLDEEGYGGEKARAETTLADLYPDRFGVARCPSIFGPMDPGSTLHYWLRNFASSSEVLAPGSGGDPVQFVDVRDVARWLVDAAVRRQPGIFNTAAAPIPFKDFIGLCRAATGSAATATWVEKEFLYGRGVEAFSEMPLWVPVEEDPGFFQISSEKARRHGFRTRQPAETIAAAWRWYQSSFFDATTFPHNGWGVSKARQADLLAQWVNTPG